MNNKKNVVMPKTSDFPSKNENSMEIQKLQAEIDRITKENLSLQEDQDSRSMKILLGNEAEFRYQLLALFQKGIVQLNSIAQQIYDMNKSSQSVVSERYDPDQEEDEEINEGEDEEE